MKRFLPLLLILPLLLYWSCEEEVDTTPRSVTLFSATFHEEYDPSVKSFVYISNILGSVIADTSFYGSGSFVFSIMDTLGSAPEKIGITTVSKDSEGLIFLTTNLGVETGSDFHYYDPWGNFGFSGQSSYEFINIPDNVYRAYLNSKGHYARTSLSDPSEVVYLDHHYDQENVLLMVYYWDGTAGYLVIDEVQVGSSHVVDLSNLQTAEHSVMDNNTELDCDWLSAYGYNDGESYLSENRIARLVPGFGLNRMWNDEGNFILNYPSLDVTPSFRVNAYVGDAFQEPGGKQYGQTTIGSLPSSIEKINADFDVLSYDLNNFQISSSGSFDQWSVSLYDISQNASWNIYNNSQTSTMILPSIPTSVLNEYPELSNPSFIVTNIILRDWMCANDYQEWVDLFHGTDGYYLDFCSGFHALYYWPPE